MEKLEDDPLKQIVTEIAMIPTDEMISEEVLNDYIHIIRAESTDIAHVRRLEQKQKQESNPILAAQIGSEIRSEEHTSELQSRGHLVCRLLLEKKKNKKQRYTNI